MYPPESRATRSAAARASGARPRFVWMTTPVALITRRSDGPFGREPPDGASLDRVRPAAVHRPRRRPGRGRLRFRPERLYHGCAAVPSLERQHGGALTQLFDGRD